MSNPEEILEFPNLKNIATLQALMYFLCTRIQLNPYFKVLSFCNQDVHSAWWSQLVREVYNITTKMRIPLN